jgi:hypothetical protein
LLTGHGLHFSQKEPSDEPGTVHSATEFRRGSQHELFAVGYRHLVCRSWRTHRGGSLRPCDRVPKCGTANSRDIRNTCSIGGGDHVQPPMSANVSVEEGMRMGGLSSDPILGCDVDLDGLRLSARSPLASINLSSRPMAPNRCSVSA